MTKLRNFTKEENRDFSAFKFSLQLMLGQALTNLIVLYKSTELILAWPTTMSITVLWNGPFVAM